MDHKEWPEELPPSKRNRFPHCGAYVIEHIKTGKLYVGSSVNLVRRKNEHLYRLSKGLSENKNLQASYNDDSGLKWRFWITKTHEEALDVEQALIDSLKNDPMLFNRAENARNSGIGHVNPPGWERMISERNKGNRYATGRVVSVKERERLSKLHKGKKISDEHRAAVSAKFKGVPQSPELIEARRLAMRTSDKVKRKHPTINGVTYQSVVDAANALNMSKSTIKFRIKSKTEEWKDWYYLAEENEENANSGDVS